MSLLVCLGESFILDSRLAIFGKKLSFWLSVCSVLIVVPLLQTGPFFHWCLFDLRLFGFVCFLFLLVSGMRFVVVALPGLFSYLFFCYGRC